MEPTADLVWVSVMCRTCPLLSKPSPWQNLYLRGDGWTLKETEIHVQSMKTQGYGVSLSISPKVTIAYDICGLESEPKEAMDGHLP